MFKEKNIVGAQPKHLALQMFEVSVRPSQRTLFEPISADYRNIGTQGQLYCLCFSEALQAIFFFEQVMLLKDWLGGTPETFGTE